jgi:DNA-3-methyladenine glycosylase
LLGAYLVHGERVARIREVEAYLPVDDPAAHSYAGLTPRTRVIYGPPGHAYVYLNYGIHVLFNVVVEPEGVPGCVLIRAADALSPAGLRLHGPGLLARGMGIGLEHYGADLTQGPLRLLEGERVPEQQVQISPRIGIRKAADKLLRFFISPGL